MSGPKGGSYQVVSAAELARRRLAAAESAERVMAVAVAEAQARCAVAAAGYDFAPIDLRVPRRAARGDAEAIERWVAKAKEAVDRAEEERVDRIAAARSAQVASALGGLVAGLGVVEEVRAVARPERAAPVAEPAEVVDEAWRDEVARSVERSLLALDPDCDEASARSVEDFAQEVLGATSKVRARQLADVLGNDVGRANAKAREHRERQSRTRRCLEELGAWDHPATRSAREWIEAGGGATAPMALVEQRTADAVAAAATDRDRDLVAASLRRSLQSFGYVVEEGFETLVVDDGVAYVRRADWVDHAVAVRLYEGRSRVGFNVVTRAGEHDAVRDEEIEREWCGAIDQLEPALAEDGVVMHLTERVGAGAVAVQVLDADRFPFAERATTRQTKKAKQRGMDS